MNNTNSKYKECSCEHCGINSDNFFGQFVKYDNKVYCIRHYRQLKKYGYITDLLPNVVGMGINDMSYGWRTENEWNKKVYQKWADMIIRCYSEREHKRNPAYKNCIVCERWLLLSNFVEDFIKIDGYDKENFLNGELELDKDIKSNGAVKEYSLDNCMLVSKTENSIQASKTRDYSKWNGASNPKAKKIVQYDKQGNLIKIWDYIRQASEELGINEKSISACCRGKYKSAGGYIWKYHEEG